MISSGRLVAQHGLFCGGNDVAKTDSISERLRRTWEWLAPWPGGKRFFSFLVGRMAPYTGTIGAVFVELRAGYSQVQLRDRRRVRNHLRSVHAIALMNLAEVSTGMAMLMSLPADARGILAGLSMDYKKKARGLLTAECHCEIESSNERREVEIEGVIRDREGDVVAVGRARWLIGPVGETRAA